MLHRFIFQFSSLFPHKTKQNIFKKLSPFFLLFPLTSCCCLANKSHNGSAPPTYFTTFVSCPMILASSNKSFAYIWCGL